MSTALQAFYRSHGEPPVAGMSEATARCRLCSTVSALTMPFSKWLPPTATDWETWHAVSADDAICPACIWARSGKPGSEDCLRMRSHIWREDTGAVQFERFDIKAVRTILLDCIAGSVAWAAAVAGDGKKHALIYAQINLTGSTPVVGTPGESTFLHTVERGQWGALRLVNEALRLEVSRRWICEGGPVLVKASSVQIRDIDRLLRPLRGTSDLELAARLGETSK